MNITDTDVPISVSVSEIVGYGCRYFERTDVGIFDLLISDTDTDISNEWIVEYSNYFLVRIC